MKLTINEIKQQIEDFFFVETKNQLIIPFILNEIQSSFVRMLEKIIKSGRPIRIIVLKGRQFGFSTLILAIFFCKCLLIPNTRAAVIAHDDESTKKLFRRVRFFSKTFIIPPSLEKDSEREYSFPKTNSYFYIGTAGNKAFGRGDNLTDVHASEVAFWPNPAFVMNGLIQAVGKTGTMIIETTANGIGNYLHKLWVKSYENPKSAWISLFFKWTHFKEYEIEPEKGFTLTEEEEHLKKLHPELNDKKLAWRRWKISEMEADKGKTPEQVFQQEYPLTPREAFLTSGQSVFSKVALENYKTKEPIDIEDGFKIWKRPDGYSIMAIDTAEGLENKDRSVIDIYDHNLEQVAQWAGWCDTDELAKKALIFADRYKSFIISEINNMGIAVVNILKKKYPLSKIYHREVFDEMAKQVVKKIAWRTTHVSKAKLVGELASAIRTHEIKINCAETVEEMFSFINNGRGGWEADIGANDDRVITAGLALQGYKANPPKIRAYTPEEQEKIDVEAKNKKWRANHIKKLKKKYAKKH
jgi:hypothetical protein